MVSELWILISLANGSMKELSGCLQEFQGCDFFNHFILGIQISGCIVYFNQFAVHILF